MATINGTHDDSVISSEASSLLDCFVEGLDDVVYEIAEEIAKTRSQPNAVPGEPIRIEAEDVKQAGNSIITYLKSLVQSGEAPKDLGAVLDCMDRCFNSSGK